MGNQKDPSFEYNKSYAQTRGLSHIPGTNIRTGHPDPSRSTGWNGPPNMPAHQSSQYRRQAGCFPAGTLVDTPHGRQDIARIGEGDEVHSLAPGTSRTAVRRVLRVRTYRARAIWRVVFEGGDELRTTAVHSFRVGSGWRRAGDLRGGDRVQSLDAQGRLVDRVVLTSLPTGDVETVHNLIVDGDFVFIAAGAVASSFSFARGLRSLLWRVRSGATRALGGVFAHGAGNPLAAPDRYQGIAKTKVP